MENHKQSVKKQIWSQRLFNFKKTLLDEQSTSGRRKLYNSLWAILLGIILSLIIISFNGTNPFSFIAVIFTTTFGSQGFFFPTLLLVYVFAALAVGIGFKAGLFNIGVAGQMMFGALLGFIFLISTSASGADSGASLIANDNGGLILVALMISILGGFALAFIAGFLKAFFRVHEVVSTILLNWIVFYLASWVVNNTIFENTSVPGTGTLTSLTPGSFFNTGGWIAIAIVLVLGVSFIFYFIFKKTTLGFKIKAVGLNPNASEYAGVNQKKLTVLVFSLSGALAGASGFFFYYVYSKGTFNIGTQPLELGFDSIAISLLAYNSPMGIIGSAFLYSILTNGNSALLPELGLQPSAYQIIVGIIIYFAAIAVVFEKFKVFQLIKNISISRKSKTYLEKLREYKIKKQTIKKQYLTNLEKIKKENIQNKIKWKKIKANQRHESDNLLKELDQLKNKNDTNSLNRKVVIFDTLSKLKKTTNLELDSLGFYNFNDNENLYFTKILELKNELNKTKHKVLTDYWNLQFKLKEEKFLKKHHIEGDK